MAGILVLQLKSVQKDKNINFRKVEYFVKQNLKRPLDLIVLPELFSLGVENPTPEPENGGETIDFINQLAKKHNVNIIAGSVARKKDDKIYNTSFAVNRCGETIQAYDKIHLNNYFGNQESEKFSAGEQISIAEFDFARVGMAIGFDVRIPSHFISLVKSDVDIITLPAAWQVPKEVYESPEMLKNAKEMWVSICKTRAYDSGAYFIVSNQTKEIINENCALGCSMVLSPTAQILTMIEEKEGASYVDVDINLVKYLRQLFPVSKLM